jgi:hypothetical protein
VLPEQPSALLRHPVLQGVRLLRHEVLPAKEHALWLVARPEGVLPARPDDGDR